MIPGARAGESGCCGMDARCATCGHEMRSHSFADFRCSEACGCPLWQCPAGHFATTAWKDR